MSRDGCSNGSIHRRGPCRFVRGFSCSTLVLMTLAAAGFLSAASLLFHLGLHRYKSGSAIQTEV
jgi:hypothetical protein